MKSLNSPAVKRIDAALEKNLETIVTQVRRTTTKPSQLTQNDLQLFDNTASSMNSKLDHHSRDMTPDSINADSANEESTFNEPYYHYSTMLPPTVDPYGQSLRSTGMYPFPHQHPGLYLPFPPTNTGLPPFYPSYDPLLFEQHYNPHVLSAFYTQQQAAAARFLQEHAALSGMKLNLKKNGNYYSRKKNIIIPRLDNFSSMLATPTKEYVENSPSVSDDSIKLSDLVANNSRKKNTVTNKLQESSRHNVQTIRESLSRLSPDLSSDGEGGINDADSIISYDSIKSNTVSSKF